MKKVMVAVAVGVLSALIARAEHLGTIMPMGDSITLGVGSSGGGYRDPLYQLLTARGDTFTFVGPQAGHPTDLLTQNGQQYHAGYSGYGITNFAGSATATDIRNGLHENLEKWIGPDGSHPDIILLMIGTNDIDQNHEVEHAPARLDAFISSIYDYLPKVKLLLATVVPMKNERQSNMIVFNAAFPQIVASHRAKGHDVWLVPMADALDIATDLSDNLHPNASGYQKMAETWDTALHAQHYAATLSTTGNGNSMDFSVGWDFTVVNPIVVKALGQFEPNNTSADNQVALYRRGGEKIVEVTVKADAARVTNGTKSARYTPVQDILLTNGNYVIFGQQNNVYYLDVDNAATFGPGIVWNMGVARSGRGAALPNVAPEGWQIENKTSSRYFGPTFQYALASPLLAELQRPAVGSSHGVGSEITASVKVTQGTAPYTVQFFVKDTAGKVREIGQTMTGAGPVFSTTCVLGDLGVHQIYATVEDSSEPKRRVISDFNSFTVGYQRAVDAESTGARYGYNVGWRFEVKEPILVRELGVFDLNAAVSNEVALYKNRGDQIVKASIPANVKAEASGAYQTRYVSLKSPVYLPEGTYEILGMQNGQHFIAGVKDKLHFGSAITWVTGIAQGTDFTDDAKTIPRDLPSTTADLATTFDNATDGCYFGPTFKYEKVSFQKDAVTQRPLELTGWNHDMIVGVGEEAPGYSKPFSGWSFYEKGYPGGTQGLPESADPVNRTFTSAYNPGDYNHAVSFQFQPYAQNNVLFVENNEAHTLTLAHPGKFYMLQFLLTTRSANWHAQLNFSDGTSVETSTWSDPDWTNGAGPTTKDVALSQYGLLETTGKFYSGGLWMADRRFTLPAECQMKNLISITFKVTGGGTGKQLCLFAVSGGSIDPGETPYNAFELISAPLDGGANTFVLGWDFRVHLPITVTALGQFSFNNGALGNSVALYKIGGAKLKQVQLTAASTLEKSGIDLVRYQKISNLILEPGDYRIASTQTNNAFRSSSEGIVGNMGFGVEWLKGVAEYASAKLELPDDGGTRDWKINDSTHEFAYKGPTFKYLLGRVASKTTVILFR